MALHRGRGKKRVTRRCKHLLRFALRVLRANLLSPGAPPTDADHAPPVVRPRTWLLQVGWRLECAGGRISPGSVPGLPKRAPLPEWASLPP